MTRPVWQPSDIDWDAPRLKPKPKRPTEDYRLDYDALGERLSEGLQDLAKVFPDLSHR